MKVRESSATRRVAIAGAGTSGLTAALLFRKLGWEVTVIEVHVRPRTGTRAPTLWPPALHVLDLIGVADQVKNEAHLVEALQFRSDTGDRTIELGSAGCVTFSQSRLERLLEERARGAGVRVVRGVRVVAAHRQDDARIRVVGLAAVGTFSDLTVDLLIGADGYHSAVREIVGATLTGESRGTPFALRDIVDEAGRFDRAAVWTCSDGPGTLVLVPLPHNRIRFVAPFPADRGADSFGFLSARALGHGFPAPEGKVVWESSFVAYTQQATRFALGAIALIGDAAHVQWPAGGRGMNQGIEDAFTLASEVGADPKGDLVGALARYAAVREREMRDELSQNAAATADWDGAPPTEGTAPQIRSEIDIASCVFRRNAAGGVPSADASLLGRRVLLKSASWLRTFSLRVRNGRIEDSTGGASIEGEVVSVVASESSVPDGKYTLGPTMNIFSIEPEKVQT